MVLVNSNFTGSVFASTFSSLSKRIAPSVLYPPVPAGSPSGKASTSSSTRAPTFLSINRFERKKNVRLALESFAALRDMMEATRSGSFVEKQVKLVLAGGCDSRVAENVEYHRELCQYATDLGFNDQQVQFVLSFSDQQKQEFLESALAVLYTPDKEHFGIVPLECMAARRPVIAVNSGGPTETVVDQETGFLCMADPKVWAARMQQLIEDKSIAIRLGDAGACRVAEKFSFESFQEQLEGKVTAAIGLSTLTKCASLWAQVVGLFVVVLALLLAFALR